MTPGDTALTPAERVKDARRIQRALGAAVRDALLRHKRDGDPVVIWRDGRVVWVPAEEIPILPEDDGV